MALIKSITVSIRANTQKFVRGVRRAQRSLRSLAQTAGSVSVKIAKMATIMGTVAAGALGLFVKKSFAAIDNLAKTADRIGMTTEALAGLRHHAAIAGMEMSKLDRAMQYMVRNVAEVSTGVGEAKDAFVELGLDAKKMLELTPVQQFEAIVDAFQKIENQTKRVHLAMEIFGMRGVGLINIINQGKDAFQAAMKEARGLGLAINRIDAAKVEAANDAVTRLKGAFQGLFNTIAIKIAPVVERVANIITTWVKRFNQLRGVQTIFDLVSMGIAKVADVLVTVFYKIRSSFATLKETFLEVKMIITDLKAAMGKMDPEIAVGKIKQIKREMKAARMQSKLFDVMSGKHGTYEKVLDFLKKLDQDATKAGESVAKAADKLNQMRAPFQEKSIQVFDLSNLKFDVVEKFAQRWRQIADFGKEIKGFAKNLASDMRTPIERFNDFVNQVKSAFQMGFIDQTVFSRAINRAKETLETDLRAEITQERKGDEQKGLFGVINEQLMSLDVLRQRKQVQEVRDPVNEKIHKVLEEMRKEMSEQERVALAG